MIVCACPFMFSSVACWRISPEWFLCVRDFLSLFYSPSLHPSHSSCRTCSVIFARPCGTSANIDAWLAQRSSASSPQLQKYNVIGCWGCPSGLPAPAGPARVGRLRGHDKSHRLSSRKITHHAVLPPHPPSITS